MLDLLNQIALYLKPLGYETTVSEQPPLLRAEHGQLLGFTMALTAGGALMRTYIGASPLAKTIDLLTFVNDLNRGAAVVRFLVDKDGDFTMEAWWPPLADETQFLNFMDAWHHDVMLIGDHERSMDLLV